jgi:hypothetical protein
MDMKIFKGIAIKPSAYLSRLDLGRYLQREGRCIFSRSYHTDNQGMTLFFIIFIVLLIGTLLTVGMSVIGPMVKRSKYNETGATIDGAVKAVVSWSAANNRLPDNTVFPFSTIVSNPLDAWSKPLIYVYDGTMTSAATGGICGRNTTGILQGTTYVAFVIISGGDDLTVQSRPPLSIPPVSEAYTGNLNNLSGSDYFRVVTLDEMKNLAGCYGATRGRLAILNNELPTGCLSQPYTGTVFPEGGVPFAISPYQWCIQGVLPPGITASPGTVCPSWSANAASIQFSGTAPASSSNYPFTVMVRDSDNTIAQRSFMLKIKACGFSNWNVVNKAGSPGIVVNSNNMVTFGGNSINTAGCIWYPYSLHLYGNTMRTIFNFRFQNIDSGPSTNFGSGFTFAFIQGSSDTTTVCGDLTWNGPQLGALIGYGGMPGRSFAVEFDTYPDGSQNDPASNHVAVDKNGNVTHGTVGNPLCDGSDRGCIYNGYFGNTYPVTWLENDQDGDGQTETHSARIEVSTQCNSSCGACGVTGNTYANIRVWIDCSNCGDISTNYLAAPPQVTHCFLLDAALSDVKFGFTEATGTSRQTVTISNFGIGSN